MSITLAKQLCLNRLLAQEKGLRQLRCQAKFVLLVFEHVQSVWIVQFTTCEMRACFVLVNMVCCTDILSKGAVIAIDVIAFCFAAWRCAIITQDIHDVISTIFAKE